ncbi:hypothetical protein EBI_26173 [Enterocytozoon bieneusi H348]|nr:hypothetical protein EBI_26173 [Enterocytozoon bieneusi H348]|eukprot:XP_002650131.1 hypothetical protein EBI_26173 [Enterocytozoon bieneusi H348]
MILRVDDMYIHALIFLNETFLSLDINIIYEIKVIISDCNADNSKCCLNPIIFISCLLININNIDEKK